MQIDERRLVLAHERVRERVLAERGPRGGWRGELSTSALSTATAAAALTIAARQTAADAERRRLLALARGGLDWLAASANEDGGWGDTTRSRSNVSTTTLAWAALRASPDDAPHRIDAIRRAEGWLRRKLGNLEPEAVVAAIDRAYGEDRTFSAPILTHCALCGRLGEGPQAWRRVAQLPFELAACPRSWFRRLGLPVVSYALPALIAIGLARHHHLPSRRPLARAARRLALPRTLRVLEEIQPSSGGFLEAVPLTSFVVMSLAATGRVEHPVARRGLEFIARSARPDGSWPIDTDLSTWVTTLAVNALAEGAPLGEQLDAGAREDLLRRLLETQLREIHPYTMAPPGGWAWTDLPGGVPDADDTAGAVLALSHLGARRTDAREAAGGGIRWLLDLQNRDGGIPTFCRGWGKLPFDRSSADLTAHALRAWMAWLDDEPDDARDERPRRTRSGGRIPGRVDKRVDGRARARAPRRRDIEKAARRAMAFLEAAQRPDGAWTALWFGNEDAPGHESPVYASARVLAALREAARRGRGAPARMEKRGIEFLLGAQSAGGGWGGAPAVASSVEETALAVEALANPRWMEDPEVGPAVRAALERGVRRLIDAVEQGELETPAPIGLYFASLWYYEELYPPVFALAALGRARRALAARIDVERR